MVVIRSDSRLSWQLLLPAALLLCAMWPSLATGSTALDPELMARSQQQGSVRVLVRLTGEEVPPGLETGAYAESVRREIAQTDDRVERRLTPRAGRRMRRYANLPLLAAEVTPQELQSLSRDPETLWIEEDRPHYAMLTSSRPAMGADQALAASFVGNSVAVAILDTGIDASHPSFDNRVVEEACFTDGTNSCPGGSATGPGTAIPCTEAGCWHGTHVAGIAVGASPVGVAPASQIIAIKVFSKATGTACNGTGVDPCPVAFTSDLIAGLDYVTNLAASYDIAAVNLSLGGGLWSSEALCDAQNRSMKNAVDRLLAVGVPTIAASGNDSSPTSMGAPACLSSVISVGNVTDAGVIHSTSDATDFLDLFAPGTSITSAIPGGGTATHTGTSMSTPHVTGSFAVLHAAVPSADYLTLLSALTSTGLDVTDTRVSPPRITPRVQLQAALKSLTPGECYDNADNDADGLTDFPNDPSCARGIDPELTQCEDGIDNDGDARIDWAGGPAGEPPDPQCTSQFDHSERRAACGLGFELVLVLPLLLWVRRLRLRA